MSSREFKQTFKGKEGYAFYGTDLDLQKLQNKLFSDTSNITEICYVHSVGMHRWKVGKRTILVYAEPGFSVSSTREKNTHEVWGNIPAAPSIQEAKYPEADDALKMFIDNMLSCNDPQVVSTIVGWMALCHIKVQLTMRSNQFPLLNLWGNSGCVDKDTEFLTPEGWKAIGDYEEGDLVCQWNQDGSTEFAAPERYIKSPCEELVSVKANMIDMQMSMDHNMPCISRYGKFEVLSVEEILKRPNVNFHLAFKAPEAEEFNLSDELIRVLVMQSADGSFDKRRKTPIVYVNVKKVGKQDRVEKLLTEADIDYAIHKSAEGYKRFCYNPPSKLTTKSLKMLWGCSARQLAIVADEVRYWDASIEVHKKFETVVFTGNKENSDLVQYALSSTTGKGVTRIKDPRTYVNEDLYTVRTSQKKTAGIQVKANSKGQKAKIEKTVPKDGFQYCFTTGTGYWLARRNGKICVSSNSGKSALSSLFSGLHAIDYGLTHSPISLQGTTPWAVAQYCTSSESTPRLIEEFNIGEISRHKYDQFAGLFKAAFGAETFAKGGIERAKVAGINVTGARVVEAKISAPLCVMSEQAPERPALRQRMIQININRKGRDTEAREDAFYYVNDRKSIFHNLARAMVWKSLTTHPDTVAKMMDSYKAVIPREIDSRPRYAYQCLLTGLAFFGSTLTEIGLDDEYVNEKVKFMSDSILNHLSGTVESVRKEKLTTEVVLALSEMAIQAAAGSGIAPAQWSLIQGQEYIRNERYLLIDTRIAHSKYVRWARSAGTQVILTSYPQFNVLLQQEDFYIAAVKHPDLSEGKVAIAKLDVVMLKERGVPVELFEED